MSAGAALSGLPSGVLGPPPDRAYPRLLRGWRLAIYVFLLAALAFFSAAFHATQTWSGAALAMVFAMVVTVLLVGGLSLRSTAMAATSQLPGVLQFVPLGGFSITLSELFMALFLLVYAVTSGKIPLNRFSAAAAVFLAACVGSLIGSPLGLLSAGMLVRYFVLISFITILVSRRGEDNLFMPVLYGLFAIPLTACAAYAGEGVLGTMAYQNLVQFSRVVYSFHYPVWFALPVALLAFMRAPRLLIAAAALFALVLIALSYARSIMLGTAAAAVLYVLFHRDHKPLVRFVSKALVVAMAVVLAFAAAITMGFFDSSLGSGSASQDASNEVRYRKMALAMDKVKQHPLLGVGFGASADQALAERNSAVEVFEDIVSPEFGPLNVLAEIGLIGALCLLAMIVTSFRAAVVSLKDRSMPGAYKAVVLIAFGGFVASFLNGNALTQIIVYVMLIIPILALRHWEWCTRETGR